MPRITPLIHVIAAGAAAWAVSAAVHADGAVSRGALLAAMCDTCHGPGGSGSKSIPALNDLDADEIVETMKAFQEGEEDATIMDRHAKGYSEEELKAMAAHYAKSAK
ncbi:MAG: c-type cytochrome [Gammaproteobacteria bacterium]|nr:c-type cytochrome [Gammaproteobacteria bacterium]